MGFKKGKLNIRYKDGRASLKLCLYCKAKYIDYRNNKCQSCENKQRFGGKTYEELYGFSQLENGQQLDIHHIDYNK